MSILPNSPSVAHSSSQPTPFSPPHRPHFMLMLMLPAPHIAGLLGPGHQPPAQSQSQAQPSPQSETYIQPPSRAHSRSSSQSPSYPHAPSRLTIDSTPLHRETIDSSSDSTSNSASASASASASDSTANSAPNSTSDSASASDSTANSPVTFTFSDPSLATLDADQRQKLFDAAQTLLEVAVRFSTGELNHHALRAAQVLFHRRLTGHSPVRPLTPRSYRAEQDAEMIDLMLSFEKRPKYDAQAAQERLAQALAELGLKKGPKGVRHD